MQAYDELSLVVELFHQCKLFFQIHGSGAPGLLRPVWRKVSVRGARAACIEDEVCLFQHRPSSHGDKRSGAPGPATYNLDVPPALGADVQVAATIIVLAFAFRHYQLAISGGQQCGCLAYTGRAHVLHHCFAGVGHVHCRQFLGRIEEDFVFLLERFHYRFVTLDVNRRYGYDGLREMLYSSSFCLLQLSWGLPVGQVRCRRCTTRGAHSRWTVCPLYNVFAERRSVPA